MRTGVENDCRVFRIERFNPATGEHATVREAFKCGGERVARLVMQDATALHAKGEAIDLDLLQRMFTEALQP